MHISNPELLVDARALLGEGPAWDSANQRLYWIDIFSGHLHIFDPAIRLDKIIDMGYWLGCVAPMRSGGVILGLKNGLASCDLVNSNLTWIANPESVLPGNRFNDGKCDPFGRFLAGTMDNTEENPSGSLYSLSSDLVVRTLITGVRISNGLTWSPDYKVMYYIDTPTSQVKAYDYDFVSGEIANPRIAITIPSEMGWPDGMTSDVNGNLWVALWGGAAVSVWNPSTGFLVEKIDIPAKNVTSCAFGGKDQNELYVTTARKGLDSATLGAYPHTGGLFRIQTNVTGMPTFEFDDSVGK